MASPTSRRWVLLRETGSIRWGGDLRRLHVLSVLGERTGAESVRGWSRSAVLTAIRAGGGMPLPFRIPFRARPVLGSSELLATAAVQLARRHFEMAVLDVHDHAVAQADALGRPHEPALRRSLEERIEANLDAFRVLLVPSASFAELAHVDPARAVVIPNGTDTQHVVPGPFPDVPRVGFVSGAAPGRGIEMLIETARRLRADVPDLRLALWLATGDATGEAYVEEIRRQAVRAPWIEIARAPYEDLPAALATATVLAVPHPANAYLDTAVPVKLLDSMAAGRPVVVTPRTETRRIVTEAHAGAVAAGDTPDDLAAAILPLLRDRGLAERLGANGRRAAVEQYDWRVLGARVADAVLGRLEARG